MPRIFRSRPVHTANSVHIRAPRETVFETVSDLQRWPEHLPHYRFVKTLGRDGTREIVHMGAVRDPGIPISWVSAYEADPVRLELRFEHLRAWTKGMRVIWNLTPTRDGTRVEIVHDMAFRLPALRWFAEPVLSAGFIAPVATRTLETFRRLIEAKAGTAGEPTAA